MTFIAARIWMIAAVAAAVLAAAAGGWALVKYSARLEQENHDLRMRIETWERINGADIGIADPDDDLGWLRERSGQ